MVQQHAAIEVDGLGVRFRLGRRGRRSFKDLLRRPEAAQPPR